MKINHKANSLKLLILKDAISDQLFSKFITFLKIRSITNQINKANLVLNLGINKKNFVKLRCKLKK